MLATLKLHTNLNGTIYGEYPTILAASKVIEKDIDKSKHEELINNFIKEVGEAK